MAFLDPGDASGEHRSMNREANRTSIFRAYLGMLGYMMQILGLLIMPVALGLGFAIRSNRGLWWMLWASLVGLVVFYGGRALLRWAEDETISKDD